MKSHEGLKRRLFFSETIFGKAESRFIRKTSKKIGIVPFVPKFYVLGVLRITELRNYKNEKKHASFHRSKIASFTLHLRALFTVNAFLFVLFATRFF